MSTLKRFLSLALALMMVISMMPTSVFATEIEGAGNTCEHDYVDGYCTVCGGAAPAETPTEPETTEPETTVPETTVPETTVPETTVPETTEAATEPVAQADVDANTVDLTDGIDNVDELKAFADAVNGGETYEGVTVTLNADLTLTGEWTPIGKGVRSGNTYTGIAFKGTFDGADHTISGLTITAGGKNDALGLFGVVDGGTVKNLKLTDVSISASANECAGAAIGVLTGNGTADSITVAGSVSALRGNGGIVGRMLKSGTISNCTNNAAMYATGGANLGGIVGAAYYTESGKAMHITNCTNNGTITGSAGGVGGIVGLSSAIVSGCNNYGTVTGANASVGGIVGEQQNYGTVEYCTNTASVTNSSASNIYGTGGIVGWLRYNGAQADYPLKNIISVTNNNNSGTIVGGSDAGGIVGVAYNAANINGNTNTAASLTAANFGAGIVANIQFTETPVQGTSDDSVTIPQDNVTVTGNSSSTAMENINAACKDEYGYDNSTGNQEGTTEGNKTIVAQIGDVTYETLDAAFAAAAEGETITLLADATPALTSQRAITKAAVIDLGGKTLTLTEDDLYFGTTTFQNGTIVVDPSVKPSTAVFWMFENQTLTFDGVKIVATGVTGTYLIGLDGNNSDLNLLNGSEIVVENTTALDLDIICVNASTGNDIVIDNSEVNVTNLDGRVFFRGNYTVSGTSDINLAGITKAGFRIEAGQTLSIEDTANVTITGEPRDGGIHLTDATATYTKADTATVSATVNAPKVAKVGGVEYTSLAEAIAVAKAGDEITMLSDVAEDVTVPAGVIFNGNGKQVGNILAAGEITFKGLTKAVSFAVVNTNTTINIGEGATLEITGTGRLVIGHGCTFNITGTITDAKTADKATIQPSLIMPGASFTGAGVTFNVTNAYIKTTASYCSSSKSASGTFDFNIENSIWEQFGKLAFESQSTAATVNFDLKDSVLTTTSHLVFGVSRGEVVIDNSNVNVGTSRQIENQSTMTVKNGSVVNGAVATSSNAKNPGTLIVEDATYAVTGEFSGSDLGTGTLIVKNGATFSAGSVTKANIVIDATGMKAGDEVNITADLSKHAGTLEVANNGALEAEIVDGKIVLTERELPGSGTETDPYLINNLEDLILFRDMVNTYTQDGSNQFKGKYIKLTADIDLAGINWTPIGTNSVGDHAAFLGTFDGAGHTISNLYINADGDHLGFFARVGSYAENVTPTVKNITFNNVDVSANITNHWTTGHGDYVGGVIANAGGNSVVSNVKVTGDVYVVGCGYVGGIVGHGYPDIDNCSVAAEDGSYVNAGYWCAGGIIGYAGEGGTPITNCSVSGLDIWSAYGAAAAVAGLLQDGNQMNNVSASNVEITSASDYCMGYIAGNGEASTLTNVTLNNVTATANGNPITPTDAVATVDGSVYFSLQAAIDAAGEGDTVTLLADLTIESDLSNAAKGYFNIAADDKITIDLNGKTIDVTDNSTGNFIVFYNYGDLTIKNGTVNLTATNDRDWNAQSTIILNRGGNLIIESGTYSHKGGTDMAITVDNSANSFGDAYLTVQDGTIESTYTGVRMRMADPTLNGNPGNGVVYMTVEGGTIKGGSRGIWGQITNASADFMGSLTVEDGTIEGGNNAIKMDSDENDNLDVAITDGTFVGPIAGDVADISVSGGTFSNDSVENYLADGCGLKYASGLFIVETAPVAIVNNVIYTDLAEALAAAKDGSELVLQRDVKLSDTLVIPADYNVVLNMNGKTISQSKACTASYSMIENNGSLTIKGNGKISFTDTGAGDPSFGWGSYTINNRGALTVENGTIEHLGAQAFATHCIQAIFQYSGSTTINGGTISTPNYRPIRLWKGDMTINGGTFDGQVWVQCVDDSAKLTINGGSFSPNGGDGSSVFVNNSNYTAALAVTGGAFETKIGANNATALAGSVTGGSFTEAAMNGTNAVLLPADKAFSLNADGTYGIVDAVAQVTSNGVTIGYLTLTEAIAAAKAGDTVTVLKNIDLAEGIVIAADDEITLDLNGKTITGTDTTDKNFSLIDNRGTLTIKDSVGGGKMTLTATINSGWNRYSAVIANNPGGKLTVNAGTLEHLGGTDMAYGIDNLTNGKGTYAETIINDGTIKSTYRGIRQFLNGIEAQNILTVNGGTIEGANKSIWMQDPSANANTGTLTVSENATLNGDVYLSVTAGSTKWPVDVSVAAAALADGSEVLTSNVPAGYELANVDGAYGVYSGVAKIGTEYFETLAEALAAVQDGETIELLDDAEIAATTNINETITIDGNGHTITQAEGFTTNGANVVLDIFGNATVTFKNITFDAIKNVGVMRTVNANIVMDNCVVQNCEQTVSQGLLRLACGNATITNSKFLNNNCTMVITFGYDAANETDVLVVDGCTFQGNICGETAVVYFADGDYGKVTNTKFIDNSVSSAGNAATLYMGWGEGFEVSGCLFDGNEVTTTDATTKRLASAIFADGCTINGNAFVDNTATRAGEDITTTVAVAAYYGAADIGENYWGGEAPVPGVDYTVEYTRNDVAVEDYYAKYDETNGLDELTTFNYVAKVGKYSYTTLADAIAAAQAGDTVTIFEGTYTMPSMKAGITIEGEGNVLLEGTLSGTLEDLTLKNLHIKGGNAQRWAYAKGDLVFENVTFEATSVYALHFDGITDGATLLYKDCTIIGWAAMGGSPASCTFDGCTFQDNGTYGVIRTYFDTTIENCTFDVDGANTTDVYEDGIHAVGGAEVAVTGCTNINGEMINLVNVGGTSVVDLDGVKIRNVAKIGDNYYRDLHEALVACQAGETVELIADVDLAGTEWEPVDFKGSFDGQNYKISNLVVNKAGVSNVGLFSKTSGKEIKNLTIENAKVTGRLNVGVVAGHPWTTQYTNIKVTGHVEVNGMSYVGGVGGKNAYANWTDITVDVDDTSYVKATSTENGTAYRTYVGGVVGFNGEGGHTFKNISSNIKVIGDVCDIGGLFGIAHYGNKFENVTFTGSVEAPEGAEEVGGIAGVWHNQKDTEVTFTDVTSTGTVTVGTETTTGSIVGGAYNATNDSEGTTGVLKVDGNEVWPAAAKIDDEYYATLQAAIDAAQTDETVTVLKDIALAEGIVIATDDVITLDLNGKTISRDTEVTSSTAAITNNGNLTITDSSDAKTGKITAYAANPDTAAVPYYASNTITNCGVLTVKGGTIENSTGNEARAAFPIDNNSTSRDAIVTIEGGTVIGRGAIRQFANSTTNKNEVNITKGTVTGTSYAVWMQNPGSSDPVASLNISGGEVAKVLISPSANFKPAITGGVVSTVAIWSADTTNTERNPSGFITGGSFEDPAIEVFVADGYTITYANGMYGVKLNPVAKVGGVEYATLAAAVEAAKDGETVYVLRDVTLQQPVTVAAGKAITLDLMGNTVIYETTENKGESMITNKGDLTITGNGKLTYAYNGTPDTSYGYGNQTIENFGVLTVENGTVENTTAQMSHASYAINTREGATLNVEGGKIINTNGHAIRQTSFGTAANTVNISGGYIEGSRAIQVQLPGNANAAAPEMALNITGGELVSNENTYNLAVYVYSNGQSAEKITLSISDDAVINGNVAINASATNTMAAGAASVTGGTLNGAYGIFTYADADTNNAIAITGGTFASDYSEQYAEDDGYEFVENENGTYSVEETVVYVAQVGEQKFETLQEAVNAANGAEVTLLANDEIAIVKGELTVKKNGFEALIAATKGYTVLENDTAYMVVEADSVASDAGAKVAYIDLNDNGTCDAGEETDSLQAALYAATADQIVRLTDDLSIPESTIIIPTDITLDIQANTLTVKNLIGLAGSTLTAECKNPDKGAAGGKLIVPKDNIVLASEPAVNTPATETANTIYVIPVWDNTDGEDCYVFTRLRVNYRAFTAVDDVLYFEFGHTAEAYTNKTLWKDGSSDNKVTVAIRMSWLAENGNIVNQDYVYSDLSVQRVSAGTHVFTFKMNNFSGLNVNLSDLSLTVRYATDSGAVATSRTYSGTEAVQ